MLEMRIKRDKIYHILQGNIVKMYLDNKEEMKKSLKNLETEFNNMSLKESLEMYGYLLEETFETERYAIVRYGKKAYLKIYLYNEEGKRLDMRNKKVKNFHKEGFHWNHGSFEKVIVF